MKTPIDMLLESQTPENIEKYLKLHTFRSDYIYVRGVVKVENERNVGIYTEEGQRILPLSCDSKTLEKFRKVNGIIVKYFPVEIIYDENEGINYYVPKIQ